MSWSTLPVDPNVMAQRLRSLVAAGVKYGLGAKIHPLGKPANQVKKVDCSGCVRDLLYVSTDETVVIPDGSVNQHAWFESHGFKHTTWEYAKLKDGLVRIAFLSPKQSHSGIGHVLLIYNGMTYESHGGTGPDSREWGSRPYHELMSVYCVTLPGGS